MLPDLLRERPIAVAPKQVSLIDAQKRSTEANIENLISGKKIASDINTFNEDQILTHLRSVIPNLDQILSGTSSNITSEIAGQIPKDVSDLVQRNAAAKAIGGGYGGSGMHGNLVARDLGLTSLDLTQKGMDSASRWMASAKANLTPGLADVSGMFINPLHLQQTDYEYNKDKAGVDWTNAQLHAQYSLGNVMADSLDSLVSMVMGGAGSSMGNAMGGGSGGGGGKGGGGSM